MDGIKQALDALLAKLNEAAGGPVFEARWDGSEAAVYRVTRSGKSAGKRVCLGVFVMPHDFQKLIFALPRPESVAVKARAMRAAPKPADRTVQVGGKVTPECHDWLERRAQAEGRPLGHVVSDILQRAFEEGGR